MKKTLSTFRLCAIASALCLAGAAHAQFSTDGYIRAGSGGGDKNKNTCFKLGGTGFMADGLNYRLGNECDTYAELSLKNTMKFGDMQVTANIMPTYWTDRLDSSGDTPFKLAQAYVEAKGVDFAPDVNFWAGKRYYGRSDVHITDTKYTQLDGTGGGADNIDVGVGKLGVAYFRRDPGTWPGWGTAERVNVEFSTSKVNDGGWLRVLGGYVKSEEEGAHNGQSLTIQHYQDKLFNLGGGNTVYLQYARGASGLNGGFANALNGNGNDWVATDATGATWVENHKGLQSYRIADVFNWQVGRFGGQAVAHYQQDHQAGYKTTSTSLGGRLSYAFTKNFKLLGELGTSAKKPQGGETQNLTKLTIAPTISIGQGFWDRPELRLYATHASWNKAAADDASNGLPTGKRSGMRYGIQVETWW